MNTKIINGKEMFAEEIQLPNGKKKEQYYIMKVRYRGKSEFSFLNDKQYYVIRQERLDPHFFGIIDESGDDYLYALDNFEILEKIHWIKGV